MIVRSRKCYNCKHWTKVGYIDIGAGWNGQILDKPNGKWHYIVGACTKNKGHHVPGHSVCWLFERKKA